jgi:hypothetical protein
MELITFFELLDIITSMAQEGCNARRRIKNFPLAQKVVDNLPTFI